MNPTEHTVQWKLLSEFLGLPFVLLQSIYVVTNTLSEFRIIRYASCLSVEFRAVNRNTFDPIG